ncbi:MAG: hypothetical protein HZA08_07550 [Nitrospirae bacterium]|nr:hypothetical protein [Nitrospirota bacterium]
MSKWIKKASLNTPRSHTATAAYNGKIYVFGGGGADFKSLNSTEIYDPVTDTWHQGKEMPTVRSGAVAAVVNDRIHVLGGGFKHPNGQFEFFRTVEIYNPATDSWEKGVDMLMPHDYPASVVLNGHVYVLGGHHPDATTGGPMTDPGFSFCEVFEPEKNAWKKIASMPTPRFAFAAVVINNKILAIGGAGYRYNGFKNYDVVEIYDPAKNIWANAGFNTPWPAAGLGAFVLEENPPPLFKGGLGGVCIAGGKSDNTVEDRFVYFDLLTNQWMELPTLTTGRIVMGTAQIGNTLYLIGGRGPDGKSPIATVEAFEI